MTTPWNEIPIPAYPPADTPAPKHGYFDECRCSRKLRWYADGWRHTEHGQRSCDPIHVGVASPKSGAVGIAGTDMVIPPGVVYRD